MESAGHCLVFLGVRNETQSPLFSIESFNIPDSLGGFLQVRQLLINTEIKDNFSKFEWLLNICSLLSAPSFNTFLSPYLDKVRERKMYKSAKQIN